MSDTRFIRAIDGSYNPDVVEPVPMSMGFMIGMHTAFSAGTNSLVGQSDGNEQAVAEEHMRKVQSMGNLHTSRQPGPDGGSALARLSEVDQDAEERACVNIRGDDGYTSDSTVPATSSSRERKKGVPWTEDEHRLFLLGLQKLGKGDWRGISRHYVHSRTPTQVASHAQKYFIRQSNLNKRKRRSSLFDIVTETDHGTPSVNDEAAFVQLPNRAPVGPNVALATPSNLGFAAPTSRPHAGHHGDVHKIPPFIFSSQNPGDSPLVDMDSSALEPRAGQHVHAAIPPLPTLPFGAHPGMMPLFDPCMLALPLPWSYPGLPGYTMPMPAAPPIPSASANSKLCRPIPALAKPSTWPFRFPFPGIPQQGKDAESPDSSGSTNAKEAVQLAFDGSVGGPFRCLAIPGQ
mmetsp:Transcript_28144/g.53601  ORF Transcript_28144/g.53601 Transcript_28144/m.53601 type:complete len:403 (+) Transcript_28144:536-1744(+)|eukprot:CAMPEP_0114250670 /NCGR_PEP_ID=MMETSP0058-20121206/14831_1 /TAXON_ID=36894 /ORGANISM="Pyramimonas parkeae, CCMP726" /LENGTH=402 /DNA_ID=CAMNT_0001364361 /DNA_START=529 /DNA_END=1737 /DNA_ORIENTATION=+